VTGDCHLQADVSVNGGFKHMTSEHKPRRQVEYHEPDAKRLRDYAREVCDDLAAQTGDTINTNDMVNGLTDFMRIAGRIQAKYMNRVTQVDTAPEQQYGDK
jgi:hypothetical protein